MRSLKIGSEFTPVNRRQLTIEQTANEIIKLILGRHEELKQVWIYINYIFREIQPNTLVRFRSEEELRRSIIYFIEQLRGLNTVIPGIQVDFSINRVSGISFGQAYRNIVEEYQDLLPRTWSALRDDHRKGIFTSKTISKPDGRVIKHRYDFNLSVLNQWREIIGPIRTQVESIYLQYIQIVGGLESNILLDDYIAHLNVNAFSGFKKAIKLMDITKNSLKFIMTGDLDVNGTRLQQDTGKIYFYNPPGNIPSENEMNYIWGELFNAANIDADDFIRSLNLSLSRTNTIMCPSGALPALNEIIVRLSNPLIPQLLLNLVQSRVQKGIILFERFIASPDEETLSFVLSEVGYTVEEFRTETYEKIDSLSVFYLESILCKFLLSGTAVIQRSRGTERLCPATMKDRCTEEDINHAQHLNEDLFEFRNYWEKYITGKILSTNRLRKITFVDTDNSSIRAVDLISMYNNDAEFFLLFGSPSKVKLVLDLTGSIEISNIGVIFPIIQTKDAADVDMSIWMCNLHKLLDISVAFMLVTSDGFGREAIINLPGRLTFLSGKTEDIDFSLPWIRNFNDAAKTIRPIMEMSNLDINDVKLDEPIGPPFDTVGNFLKIPFVKEHFGSNRGNCICLRNNLMICKNTRYKSNVACLEHL